MTHLLRSNLRRHNSMPMTHPFGAWKLSSFTRSSGDFPLPGYQRVSVIHVWVSETIPELLLLLPEIPMADPSPRIWNRVLFLEEVSHGTRDKPDPRKCSRQRIYLISFGFCDCIFSLAQYQKSHVENTYMGACVPAYTCTDLWWHILTYIEMYMLYIYLRIWTQVYKTLNHHPQA